jgi:hypothetical protein
MGLGEYLKNRRFLRLQQLLAASVQPHYLEILEACEQSSAAATADVSPEDDLLVRRGLELRAELLGRFRNICAARNQHRYLIHVPPASVSPAGYSWFTSIAESFAYLGIPVRTLSWQDSTGEALQSFSPTILLTSDSRAYLTKIDWECITAYRKRHPLFLGLTASLAEYGNTPLSDRLAWSRNHAVSFFYSFRSQEYVKTRRGYSPFFDAGYRILSLEFAANPLHHYPAYSPQKLVDYAFLGSINYDKWGRYNDYFPAIAKRYTGFVAGPAWSFTPGYTMKAERDRHIYAQARIGLNLSIEEQIRWPCELNERTYILAACGIPQLIDNPQLLPARFSGAALFSAATPRSYCRLFKEMLAAPEECSARAMKALDEVFARHTTFHRVEAFARQVASLLPDPSADGGGRAVRSPLARDDDDAGIPVHAGIHMGNRE